MSRLLEAALQYAGRGWSVFPLHTIVNGRCTCGKTCDSPGKHPRTRNGAKAATTDARQIEAWWAEWPDANIGLATGPSGLVILDVDGPEGLAQLKALRKELPRTLVSRTGREGGLHLVYRGSGVSSSQRKGEHLDVRGTTGYVVAPPSLHHSGRFYAWVDPLVALAAVPAWIGEWVRSRSGGHAGKSVVRTRAAAPKEIPPYLMVSAGPAVAAVLLAVLERVPWSEAEEARLRSALAAIPPDIDGRTWDMIGAACYELQWLRADGSDLGLDIWDDWSLLSTGQGTGNGQYRGRRDLEQRWKRFAQPYAGTKVTVATIYRLARTYGWNPERVVPTASSTEETAGSDQKVITEANGNHALPAVLTAPAAGIPIRFVDLDEDGRPKATCTNAGVAIVNLGVTCRKDVFHEKMLVGGHPIEQWAGDLSDDVVHMLRKTIKRAYGFDPGERNARDAAIQLCLEHQFNPVVEYLDALRWDGVPRLGQWTSAYLGASNTALNQEIGRLMLVAAVRRARAPGTKFDQIVVLEGREGTGKSTAIRILAGDDNFSDQNILAASDREQQEAFCGVWIHEIAELAGMRRTDVERIKQFASRTEDRARPAYGRIRVDMRRRGIFVATTNEDTYLKSETGNRRFWPVETGRVDLVGLRRDRDQLWAEAAYQEGRGESIALGIGLRWAAGEAQDRRMEKDAWEDILAQYVKQHSVTSCRLSDVLVTSSLGFKMSEINQTAQNRVARALLRLGFVRVQKREGERRCWFYEKNTGDTGDTGDTGSS